MTERSNKDDFDFYLKFAKQLILSLSDTKDRILAAAWIQKLRNESTGSSKLRTDYLKLLLFSLQRKHLVGPFAQNPADVENLEEFPSSFKLNDIAKALIEEEYAEDQRKNRFGHDIPPVCGEVSSDLLEYASSQDIPNFGTQIFYAISTEPIHKWTRLENALFPKPELDISERTAIASVSATTNATSVGQLDVKDSDTPDVEEVPKRSPKFKSPIAQVLGDKRVDEEEIRQPPTWGSNLLTVTEPPDIERDQIEYDLEEFQHIEGVDLEQLRKDLETDVDCLMMDDEMAKGDEADEEMDEMNFDIDFRIMGDDAFEDYLAQLKRQEEELLAEIEELNSPEKSPHKVKLPCKPKSPCTQPKSPCKPPSPIKTKSPQKTASKIPSSSSKIVAPQSRSKIPPPSKTRIPGSRTSGSKIPSHPGKGVFQSISQGSKAAADIIEDANATLKKERAKLGIESCDDDEEPDLIGDPENEGMALRQKVNAAVAKAKQSLKASPAFGNVPITTPSMAHSPERVTDLLGDAEFNLENEILSLDQMQSDLDTLEPLNYYDRVQMEVPLDVRVSSPPRKLNLDIRASTSRMPTPELPPTRCPSPSVTRKGKALARGTTRVKSSGMRTFDVEEYDGRPLEEDAPNPTILQVEQRRIVEDYVPDYKPETPPPRSPFKCPSKCPTRSPSKCPSRSPSKTPSQSPFRSPFKCPSRSPSKTPSQSPFKSPSKCPSRSPPSRFIPPFEFQSPPAYQPPPARRKSPSFTHIAASISNEGLICMESLELYDSPSSGHQVPSPTGADERRRQRECYERQLFEENAPTGEDFMLDEEELEYADIMKPEEKYSYEFMSELRQFPSGRQRQSPCVSIEQQRQTNIEMRKNLREHPQVNRRSRGKTTKRCYGAPPRVDPIQECYEGSPEQVYQSPCRRRSSQLGRTPPSATDKDPFVFPELHRFESKRPQVKKERFEETPRTRGPCSQKRFDRQRMKPRRLDLDGEEMHYQDVKTLYPTQRLRAHREDAAGAIRSQKPSDLITFKLGESDYYISPPAHSIIDEDVPQFGLMQPLFPYEHGWRSPPGLKTCSPNQDRRLNKTTVIKIMPGNSVKISDEVVPYEDWACDDDDEDNEFEPDDESRAAEEQEQCSINQQMSYIENLLEEFGKDAQEQAKCLEVTPAAELSTRRSSRIPKFGEMRKQQIGRQECKRGIPADAGLEATPSRESAKRMMLQRKLFKTFDELDAIFDESTVGSCEQDESTPVSDPPSLCQFKEDVKKQGRDFRSLGNNRRSRRRLNLAQSFGVPIPEEDTQSEQDYDQSRAAHYRNQQPSPKFDYLTALNLDNEVEVEDASDSCDN